MCLKLTIIKNFCMPSAFVYFAGATLPEENEGLFRTLISTSIGILKKIGIFKSTYYIDKSLPKTSISVFRDANGILKSFLLSSSTVFTLFERRLMLAFLLSFIRTISLNFNCPRAHAITFANY